MQASRRDPSSDDHPPRPWPLRDGEGLRDELLAAYGAADRVYHDVRHLDAVLARLGELADAGVAYAEKPVLLAAWFHDAVYDGERDAEERSAAWAEEVLPELTGRKTVAEVVRLVRLTESHDPTPDDVNGCALSDADLGILATGRKAYEEYAGAVRAEYAHLSDKEFRKGRARVLDSLVERPSIFRTAYGRETWEAKARANIGRELERLRG